ncbi:MAG: dihydropteroate synthase [Bacteroidales bacterium]|nr:dihydropteroate synthase [Bacteroidales bacterium]
MFLRIMGILNITPDSFSDGGRYNSVDNAIIHCEKMLNEGADIIDIGAESTRPFSDAVSEAEEIARIRQILPKLVKLFPKTLFSVDTYRAETAKIALNEGVKMVNDVTGGQYDEKIFAVTADFGASYVLMHTKGMPKDMQVKPEYNDLLGEIKDFFAKQIQKAENAGIKDIIIDPGFGFGKTIAHNFELLRRLDELKIFGKEILVGVSRKSFIRKTLNVDAQHSDNGTTIVHTIALMKGADILRVHNVKNAVETRSIVSLG